MSRGESYGGGQSSLGYLFGSDDKQQKAAPVASPTVYAPPYGIDTTPEQPPQNLPPSDKQNITTNYHQATGQQNSSIFLSGRPSTKVNSVPGGDSSLGYLFGDKSS